MVGIRESHLCAGDNDTKEKKKKKTTKRWDELA